jgi:ABC-type Fe3+-citrate transport system substrate-binding protein
MSKERSPQCILGNGECPTNCNLHSHSKKITDQMGENFNPSKVRRLIIFADSFSDKVNIINIVNVMQACKIEAVERNSPAILTP